MSKHTHVMLWVPLLYAVLFFIFWVRIYQNEVISFEEYVLEKKVNYAADSAIDELLAGSGDTNQDYANQDYQTLEPGVAVDDFAHTLCLDFKLIPTETTLALVKNKFIRTMAVCVYDGVYAYYPMQTETHTYELKQTPKIPYFYTGEDGTQYCLTLDTNVGFWDAVENGSYKIKQRDTYVNKPSDDIQATAINDQVASILNWALYETYKKDKQGSNVTLPAIADTVRGNQPVKSPTVIAVVDGFRKSFATTITAECIGGSQLEDADQVVGFTLVNAPIYKPYFAEDEGVYYYGDEALKKAEEQSDNLVVESYVSGKYYAYSSWWKNHTYLRNDDSMLTGGEYFDTVFEAASNGYNDINLCN